MKLQFRIATFPIRSANMGIVKKNRDTIPMIHRKDQCLWFLKNNFYTGNSDVYNLKKIG